MNRVLRVRGRRLTEGQMLSIDVLGRSTEVLKADADVLKADADVL
ncbi:MAG: hypothetical protein AB8B50_20390 [Pirellulaceae bacterium]